MNGPQHSWSRKLVEGLVAFVGWHEQTIRKKFLSDGGGQWNSYTQALKQLSMEVTQGGAWKRISENKARQPEARETEDLKKIRSLPSREQTRHGVRRAQLQLMHIARTALEFAALPESLQSETNA